MTTRAKALIFLLVCVMILAALYWRGVAEQKKAAETVLKEEVHFQKSFGEVSLIGKAAYVYDVRNQTALYARNENAPMPLASLTKVMTALTALDTVPEKAVITVSAEALGEEGDSGLLVGERWSLADLARFMLVSSSNDGAKAISLGISRILSPDEAGDGAFIRAMNDQANRLGLASMSFTNPTGLDADDLSSTGGTASARDMTVVAVELLRSFPSVFTATAQPSVDVRSLDGVRHTGKNTNSATGVTQLLFSSKTGYTDLAGGNLSIIFDAGPGRPVAVTVLGSTESGRFADVATLVRATMRYITAN